VSKATKHRIDIVIRHHTDIAINNSSRNLIDPLANSRVRTNLNIKLRALRIIRNLNSSSSSDLNFLSSNSLNSSKSYKTLSSSSVRLYVMAYLSRTQTYLMQRLLLTYLLMVRDIGIRVLVCSALAVVHLATEALCALFLKLNDCHDRRTNT
jgi:hypothetical protein